MNAAASVSALPVKRIRGIRLHVPVFFLWLLLLPFAPLLLLALLIVCAVYGVNPVRAAVALFRVLARFKGIHVAVQTREVSITVGLF
jgi:hypothetical protein